MIPCTLVNECTGGAPKFMKINSRSYYAFDLHDLLLLGVDWLISTEYVSVEKCKNVTLIEEITKVQPE